MNGLLKFIASSVTEDNHNKHKNSCSRLYASLHVDRLIVAVTRGLECWRAPTRRGFSFGLQISRLVHTWYSLYLRSHVCLSEHFDPVTLYSFCPLRISISRARNLYFSHFRSSLSLCDRCNRSAVNGANAPRSAAVQNALWRFRAASPTSATR